MIQRLAQTAEETRALGAALGGTAQPGDVLWLHGELAAGKTEMTKGIAAGLGCADPVSSPSFALIHEYHGGRLPLFHIDLYRLEGTAALDLGLEDYLEDDGVTVIEWGERLPRDFFPDGLEIYLACVDDGEARRLTLQARGSAGAAWLARVLAALPT
ncbi:MAG TPA: tRNA (adenosine(37)-N6)-threonylcarbamoyltransferase complex ATPase subunit type 1 TsaE [Armatimonadota bacterium]